jgi:hypothetical protein
MFSSKTEWSFIDQQCDVGEQSSPICNVPSMYNHGTANDTYDCTYVSSCRRISSYVHTSMSSYRRPPCCCVVHIF